MMNAGVFNNSVVAGAISENMGDVLGKGSEKEVLDPNKQDTNNVNQAPHSTDIGFNVIHGLVDQLIKVNKFSFSLVLQSSSHLVDCCYYYRRYKNYLLFFFRMRLILK